MFTTTESPGSSPSQSPAVTVKAKNKRYVVFCSVRFGFIRFGSVRFSSVTYMLESELWLKLMQCFMLSAGLLSPVYSLRLVCAIALCRDLATHHLDGQYPKRMSRKIG